MNFPALTLACAVALTLAPAAIGAAIPCDNTPVVNFRRLVTTSSGGTVRLIGFDEFTAPSNPPKRYRRKEVTGTLHIGEFGNSDCTMGPYSMEYHDGRDNDRPPGWGFGPINWRASLVPIETFPDGRILYRALAIGRPPPDPANVFINVDQGIPGSSEDVTFGNGDEKFLNPVANRPPFRATAYSPEVAGWGTGLSATTMDFVPPAIHQQRDVWNIVRHFDRADPAGQLLITNIDDSARFVGQSSIYPLSGGTLSGRPTLDAYAGLSTETRARLQRTISGNGQCVGGRNLEGSYTESLSDEDTEQDALARTPITSGSGAAAYRLSRTGFEFEFRNTAYTADFEVPCPGSYDIVVTYSVRPHGPASGGTRRKFLVPDQQLETGPKQITGTVRYVEGVDVFNSGTDLIFGGRDLDYTVEDVALRRRLPCSPNPGDGSHTLASVHSQFGLGLMSTGRAAGELLLEATSISPELFSPAALVAVLPATPEVERIQATGSSLLRQVRTPQTFADIVVTSPFSYEIRFYAPTQVGARNPTTGVYAVTGVPFVTHTIDDPEAGAGNPARLRIVETRGSQTRTFIYTFTASTSTWDLSSADGLRRVSETTISGGGERVRTTVIRDQANVVSSKTTRTYRTFPWGEELTREVLDPDGAALTTAYEFHDNIPPTDPNYGRLRQRTDPNGGWQRLTYTIGGRVQKSIGPFLNAPPSTLDESQCRVTENAYDAVPDSDGDGQPEQRATTTERILGQVTGRRYRIDWSRLVSVGGDLCQRRSDLQCVIPGADWDAASNLLTETLTLAAGPFVGRDRRVIAPDGTITLTSYAPDGDGGLTITSRTGQPTATRDDVVDGRRTVSVMNASGQIASEQIFDVTSGRSLSLRVATQFDSFARPTRFDFDDGTFSTAEYGCCGLTSERDRSGLVTAYAYDPLGRRVSVTQLGLTTRTAYDAANRIRSITRVGTDGSELPQSTQTYDLAGRRVEQRDALNRLTTFHEVFNSTSGITTRTTTHPDGGTRIETTARDGSLLGIGGTAVPPRVFEYGVDATGVFVKEILTGDEGGAPTATEWTRRYRDFAGRTLRSVFADGATEQLVYNSLGQLVRRIDPDGIITLFGYNALGEQDTIALDLNGNHTIDYAGPDRIRRTTRAVAAKIEDSSTYTVFRTTTQVWEIENQNAPVDVLIEEQSTDGRRSWQTARGLVTKTVTALDGSGGRTVTTTTADGGKSIEVYVGERLASHTLRTSTDVQLSGVTHAYDAHGRPRTATDARNGTTTFTYYPDDRIHTVTTPDPDPARTEPGYDPQVSTYTYDAGGRPSTVTRSDGGIAHSTYWPTGALRRSWGSRTYPVEYAYDPQGRVRTLTTWQHFGTDSGRAVTRWNYHPQRGWLENKRYQDNTGPSYTYKPSGRLLTRTWARSPATITSYTYNGAGDLSGTDYSDSTPDVTIAYDRAGRPSTLMDGSGTRTLAHHPSGQIGDEVYTAGTLGGIAINRSYDSLHRLTGVSVPSISSVAYAYDAVSRLDTVTAGQTVAMYGYLSNSSRVETVAFKHNGTTRLLTTKTHDRLNRLTSTTSVPAAAPPLSHAYTYNAANLRTRVTREDGAYLNYGYDELGQVSSGRKFGAGGQSVPGHDYAWAFDDIGNRRTSIANGAVSTHAPNPLNQYSDRAVSGSIGVLGAADPAATVTVALDQGPPQPTLRQGELFYRQFNVPNAAAAQNPILRITGVRNLAGPNQEDAVTELTQSVFIARTPEIFVHDADGNLIADSRWSYTWDAENRLIAMETAATAATSGATRQRLEFAYDAEGRRVSKRVLTWHTGSGLWIVSAQLKFVYDGWLLLAELNALAANSPLRTYVWGLDLSGTMGNAGGIGGLLAINDAATGTTHFAAYDGTGNLAALVKASDGTLTARYDYNAFGEPMLHEGPFAHDNPFRFSTKYTDPESGHAYFGYRCYAPETGRWLSRDLIGEAGGENVYGFTGNAPTSWVDPRGLAFLAFDGTNNDAKRDVKRGTETNVYILYTLSKDPNQAYTAGAGTQEGPFNFAGLMFGYGGQGRISTMMRKADEFIRAGDMVFDIVGYSRGAAEARDFANELKKKHPCVHIRWMGLFDTVATEGLPNNINIGYNLGIPEGTGSVLHLVAGDERRARLFALTSIRSGPDLPTAHPRYREVAVPNAVHSDVGGNVGFDGRQLANAALAGMWQDAVNHGVALHGIPGEYADTKMRSPRDSRYPTDKAIELLTQSKRTRIIYFAP